MKKLVLFITTINIPFILITQQFAEQKTTTTNKEISIGYAHGCALNNDGHVKCWGAKRHGQSTPPNTKFKSVSAGQYHTCGITTNDTVICWGSKKPVPGFASPILPAEPKGKFTQVSAGEEHTCAINSQKQIICWGTKSTINLNIPTGKFVSVKVGDGIACALNTKGKIQCWGTAETRGEQPHCTEFTDQYQNGTITKIQTENLLTQDFPGHFTAIDVYGQALCGLREDKSISCWGNLTLGDGCRLSINQAFGTLTGEYTKLKVNYKSICALKNDNTLKCWTEDKTQYPKISFRDIDLGAFDSCGILLNGTIKCWDKTNYVSF